jgi:hypothetical protein
LKLRVGSEMLKVKFISLRLLPAITTLLQCHLLASDRETKFSTSGAEQIPLAQNGNSYNRKIVLQLLGGTAIN